MYKKLVGTIKKNYLKIVAYAATVIISFLLLVAGHKYTYDKDTLFLGGYDDGASKGVVTSVISNESEQKYISGEYVGENIRIVFECKLSDGNHKGETVTAFEQVSATDASKLDAVKVGDKVLVANAPDGEYDWYLHDFDRTGPLWVLGIAFVVLVLVFGRFKGVNTLISLGYTCAAVFMVFVPSVLSGKNIYLWSIMTCIYITVMTLLITNGFNRKTLAAVIGCSSGVAFAGILTGIASRFLRLTGFTTEDTIYISQNFNIDLKAVIFAGIILGSVGAVMDVSVSISSSLKELHDQVDHPAFKGLVKSGVTIGRDIMGTMANTLVLAYIGCELTATLLSAVYSSSLTTMFSREKIVEELLQALVGSIGILLTIPLTAVISSLLYMGLDNVKHVKPVKRDKYYIEPSEEPSLFENAKTDKNQ